MLNLIYNLIKDFGALGVGIAQFLVIIFFGYKLFTNHLKHITDKINTICNRLTGVEEEMQKQGKQIAKLEGKLE
jgi:hypothetical protein